MTLIFTVNSYAVQVNKIASSTPSKIQPQLSTASSLIAASTLQSQNGSSGNFNSTGTGAAQTTSSGHIPAVQPHAPTPGQSGSNIAAATAGASNAATEAASNAGSATISVNLQAPSVIQATPTIAFAAVAKHNTCRTTNQTYEKFLLKDLSFQHYQKMVQYYSSNQQQLPQWQLS